MILSINNLIWIDLEMTGLNPDRDRILEIAILVTNSDLQIISKGPVFAIYQSMELLGMMDQWNIKAHTASGLISRVQNSKISERSAEIEILKFLKPLVPAKCSPMCGNSVAQDRRFLFKYMPDLENYFHYRYLDVSTLKELARIWKPEILLGVQKKGAHRALDDIYDSIAELVYYRQYFIRC
ncbi:Oligoribonuclease [Candidatus Erwinia haradaeae]|uniref:Oligoribonuclease n=1 Tax=Candidatus Erwinia haradaeae TaxID=1922217 RepID=A0A451DJH3_9GAMM|nr:oligoribonuclease [Candidatus Erwinia haradaeae]VFP86859.1 Oligoribonuclease [Candidatus Erwinia haradaeae]